MKENKMTESEKRTDDSFQIGNDFERYTEIFESYQNHFSSEDECRIWRCRAIIELMNSWTGKNKTFITNALILIMALSDNNSPDHIYNQGRDNAKLSVAEREACAYILAQEIA